MITLDAARSRAKFSRASSTCWQVRTWLATYFFQRTRGAYQRGHRAASACCRQCDPLAVDDVGGVRLHRGERLPIPGTRITGHKGKRRSGSVGQQSGVALQSLHPLSGAGYRVEVLAETKDVE
jgi:hypothetical protein